MSRSYKKTPIMGICSSKGMKKFRTQENQAERSRVKHLLKAEKELLPHPKEYQNEWDSPRDGKFWQGDKKYHKERWYKKAMRK